MRASVVSAPQPVLHQAAEHKCHQLIVLVALSSCVYFAALVYYAAVRPIDADEGFYATAARLVWEGKTPYRNFFYQQAPLLPYIYSWVWGIQPRSLLAMRLLSAVFGGAAVMLWGIWLVKAKPFSSKVTLASFVVILLNPYWISWHVVVKTYAFSNFLMTVALIALSTGLQSARARWFCATGIALGLCASARSFYGPLIPVVLVWLLARDRRSLQRYSRAGMFSAGALIGLLPIILSFARDPHAFLFNNVQYHGMQAGYMPVGDQPLVGYQSWEYALLGYLGFVFLILLGLHFYFTTQLVVAGIGFTSFAKVRKQDVSPYTPGYSRFLELTSLLFLAYTLVALIPFFPYDQYFTSPLVSFLVPFIAVGWSTVFSYGRKWLIVLAVVAPLLVAQGIRRESWEYSRAPIWQIPEFRKVTSAITTNSSPHDVVLSFWPGYVFESGREYLPGMEDQFSYRIINLINPEARAKYHLIAAEQIIEAVSNRMPAVLVIAPPKSQLMRELYANFSANEITALQTAVHDNYSLVTNVDDVEIYRQKPEPKASALP